MSFTTIIEGIYYILVPFILAVVLFAFGKISSKKSMNPTQLKVDSTEIKDKSGIDDQKEELLEEVSLFTFECP